MQLSFEKYHGLGNDFLVVRASSPEALTPAQAVALCDRHFGVGGDGVLLVSPGDGDARARMTVLNSDGSRPEMCGNGLRCVALYLAREASEDAASFVVATDAGPRRCDVRRSGAAGVVRTAMGRATLEAPIAEDVDGAPAEFARVSMGNPHAICFRPKIDASALDRVGAHLSSRIEGGSNVEVATIVAPTEITVDVWERGVGRTLACGTGAAATAVAAVVRGASPAETPLTVRLPGGPLEITVSRDLDVELEGPAAWVYSGTVELP